MLDEHFMRGWTHSHERLSADLDRGIVGLKGMFRRFVELVTPPHAPGEDIVFGDMIRGRRRAGQAVRARIRKGR